MDLSQQELPLTAYFSKGSKETRHRAASSKKGTSSEVSTLGGSSKRKRTAEGSARNSMPCPLNAQLPTPASSARKRVSSLRGVRETSRKSHLATPGVTGPEGKAVVPSGVGAEQPEPDSRPSKSSSRLPRGTRDSLSELADPHPTTPSIDRRKRQRTNLCDPQPSHCRTFSKVAEIALPTPLTASRGMPEKQSPRECSPHQSLPGFETERLSRSGASHKALSPFKLPAQSAGTLSRSRVGSASSDPFWTCDISAVSASDGTRSSKLPDIPVLPVPSSQSQYLLRVDATPKRPRVIPRVEFVSSSQTQEERELTLEMSPEDFALDRSMVAGSSGKHSSMVIDVHTPRSRARLPRLGRSERKSQHTYTLGSTPIASPVTSPAGPSRSFFATNRAIDVPASLKTQSPLRHQTKTPRKSPREKSAASLPLIPDDDSVTEPESELDITQMEAGTSPRHHPLQVMDQAPSACTSRSPRSRKFTQARSLHGDESATEAESDTEIMHCVAEISRNRGRERPLRTSSEDIPSRPIISPLVSPARSRVAASIAGSTQFFMQEGAGLSIPACRFPSRPATSAQLSKGSESVPSVVRNFIDMFQGDESYPADFPESLRF